MVESSVRVERWCPRRHVAYRWVAGVSCSNEQRIDAMASGMMHEAGLARRNGCVGSSGRQRRGEI